MAAGVARRLGATAGVATTGVAGPDPAEGERQAEFLAVFAGGGAVVQTLALSGSRDEIRRGTVERSLRLLWSVLGKKASDYSVTSSANTATCALPHCR